MRSRAIAASPEEAKVRGEADRLVVEQGEGLQVVQLVTSIQQPLGGHGQPRPSLKRLLELLDLLPAPGSDG